MRIPLDIMKNIDEIIIPNHKCSKLSDLDMAIVHSVPPGGNWKNIPLSIPSKRIDQIRESYAQGKGSRSTYYGRLLKNMPSYTMNTYFNRPGNGCHIHYEQNRVLSQREAARLQSFPDSFDFSGSMGAIMTQIGNAVPPLLSFQIAETLTKKLGSKGCYIDLFSGAGGLGLGFKWAGWESKLASDIEPKYLETFGRHIHPNTISGSLSDPKIFDLLVNEAIKIKKENSDKPFWILGGPPCQGFSTAGNARSMEDDRNHLFQDYKKFIEKVQPDGFLFENVAGLLSMQKGAVFEEVKSAFNSVVPSLQGWVLNSENYAIPQRRKRVFLIGFSKYGESLDAPPHLTQLKNGKLENPNVPPAISVEEALSDLPAISHNQDGSSLEYKTRANTLYQKLMRGEITPSEYITNFV
jgi:DNA (cytosine-5)-methyltransferase 1